MYRHKRMFETHFKRKHAYAFATISSLKPSQTGARLCIRHKTQEKHTSDWNLFVHLPPLQI